MDNKPVSGIPTFKRRIDNDQEKESKKLNFSSSEESKIQLLRNYFLFFF